MIDSHIHIERGPYTYEWLMQFIHTAQSRRIDEIVILEHSHRFIEFKDLYHPVMNDKVHGNYQRDWINKKCVLNLRQYEGFITEMRRYDLSIKISFGLEICFMPGAKDIIQKISNDFEWDCLTGSIHWIDGWGFDHPSNRKTWESVDVNDVYKRYYELMIDLAESNLFHVLAHPDSIKCFHYYPSFDLSPFYFDLSNALSKNRMKVEFSCGLKINYQYNELGPNRDLLDAFISNGVELVTASDAHRPEDVGLYIKEAAELIDNYGTKSYTAI